jgi:hypothetical protein
MAEATGWLNMARGWRKATERLARRGPTQREAQERKAKREAWIDRWVATNRGSRDEAMMYLPTSLAA